jgi:hypothetical protein
MSVQPETEDTPIPEIEKPIEQELSIREYETFDPFASGAIDKIASSLRNRDGFRHLWLGDTGMGKTEANKELISSIQRTKLIDITLTVDDKNRWKPQYQGTFRANPEHLKREPIREGEDTSNIVFRGIALTTDLNDGVNPADVARMGWELVRLHPCSILLNIDELADATNGYQHWVEEVIPQIYRKGRGVGLSIIAANQLPQLLPREAFGLSDTIGVFRLSEYLYRYRVIEKEDIAIIENLKVGEWRLFQKSAPRDSNIYKFNLKGIP